MVRQWHSEEQQAASHSRFSSGTTAEVLMNLLEEVVAVHQRLQTITEELHGPGELTRACRGILRDLYRLGPRTVPQLARNRPVSRQNVLMLVHRLVKEGMVEFSRNPEHRRSHLVRLTARGKELLEAMWEREMTLLNNLELDIPLHDLQAAAEALKHLRAIFEQFPFPGEDERKAI